jgi:hypothetical protein
MSRFRKEWLAVVAMTDWFDERGYRLIHRQGPEGMDQGFHLFEGRHLGIRITADRSQWFVEIRLSEGPNPEHSREIWFDLELWSICLGQPTLFHVSEGSVPDQLANSWTLRPQVDYLKNHIGHIEARVEGGRVSETAARLRKAQNASG